MECHANLIVTVNNLHNSVSDDTNFGKQLRIPKDICMFRTALSQSIALSRTALRLAERCLALSSWKLSINTLHQQLFCLQEEPSFLYNLSEESILFLKPSFKYDPISRPKARWIHTRMNNSYLTTIYWIWLVLGWSDFWRKRKDTCQIVSGSQFQNFTFYCCFFNLH